MYLMFERGLYLSAFKDPDAARRSRGARERGGHGPVEVHEFRRYSAPFKKGDKVTYIPHHADGDMTHPSCQHGVVCRMSPSGNVFVKYDCLLGEAKTGDEDWTAQATCPENLVRR